MRRLQGSQGDDQAEQQVAALRKAIMHIRAHEGRTVTVNPRVGGLQGDSCMTRMFSAACDKGLDKWNEAHDWGP